MGYLTGILELIQYQFFAFFMGAATLAVSLIVIGIADDIKSRSAKRRFVIAALLLGNFILWFGGFFRALR